MISIYPIIEKNWICVTRYSLFNDTVKNNLIWVCEDQNQISDDQITNALKLSNSYEFVEKLKDGINTNIEENGTQLSRGQRQRLSLARIFLKNQNF